MTLEVQTISPDNYTPLTLDEAVALTEAIRLSVADLELKIVEAYLGQAWKIMDYESWDDYVRGEFKQAPLALPREDRRTTVASLRSQGLSQSAIAAVTGVDQATISRDVMQMHNQPDRITGIDGKTYAASPRVSQTESETKNDTPPEVREACPYCGQILPVDIRKEG